MLGDMRPYPDVGAAVASMAHRFDQGSYQAGNLAGSGERLLPAHSRRLNQQHDASPASERQRRLCRQQFARPIGNFGSMPGLRDLDLDAVDLPVALGMPFSCDPLGPAMSRPSRTTAAVACTFGRRRCGKRAKCRKV